jgi:hypothetical protein
MLNNQVLKNKLKLYYLTTIFSLIFAVVGFSYNAWRLEVSEDNNNIRTASFEVLTNLAELEQVIFAAHYDQDEMAGNPRIGWIKIGLINDLSNLVGPKVEAEANILRDSWSDNWLTLGGSQADIEFITQQIDAVRREVKKEIKNLD